MEFSKAASWNDCEPEQKTSSSTANATLARMSTSHQGHLEQYDKSTNNWPLYKERLTSYLQANQVTKDDKVYTFPSLIGPKTYICSPEVTVSARAAVHQDIRLTEGLAKRTPGATDLRHRRTDEILQAVAIRQ